jgi:D-3-phosphoglycerate dehydrogenase
MASILCVQSIHEAGMKILRAEAATAVASDPSDATVIREGKDAAALVVRLTKVSASLMDRLPGLKIIGRHGIGVDTIDVEAATLRGILVINVPGEMAQAVAEHAFTLLLCLQKKILPADRAVRAGEYHRRDALRGAEMQGKTLGLVGLGRTGRLVAAFASALGMEVIGYDPFLPAGTDLRQVAVKSSLEEVLGAADMVSLHIPLTEATQNLFNRDTFHRMKQGALLVNVSRGGVVNEDDLHEAVQSRQIGGAGLDVFQAEPPDSNSPLFSHPNVVVTPHNAGMTGEAVVRMSTMLARDVTAALRGERPRNPVNPVVLEK